MPRNTDPEKGSDGLAFDHRGRYRRTDEYRTPRNHRMILPLLIVCLADETMIGIHPFCRLRKLCADRRV